MPELKRAVFLDRDGVINNVVLRDGKPYPPTSLADMKLAPDVDRSLGRLRKMGFVLIVVTNQPDVARGRQSRETIEQMHQFLLGRLPIDDIYVCYHDNADRCECRKPAPGMLLAAAKKYDLDLERSFMIGDRWSDVEAGRRAKCRTLFLNRQYSEKQPESLPSFEAETLTDAVDWIVAQSS